MDFSPTPKANEMCQRMWAFMREEVFPAEAVYGEYRREHNPHAHSPIVEKLKASAKRRGLWNPFSRRSQV